jgi:serine/threonine-protein kinase
VTQGPLARVTVPALSGREAGDAKVVLRREGLLVTERQVPDEHVAAGLVVALSPAAGTRVEEDSTVVLSVSAGPELHNVPDLSGRTEAEARADVQAAGLTVGKVLQDWSATVPAGRVASQQTPPQPPLRAGSEVSFTVSKGPEPIDVPQVVGTVQADATKAITDAGLVVGAVTHQPSTTVTAGAVVRQSPAGPLHRGDTVDLVVSDGPPVVDVPDVRGRSADDARAALEAVGLQATLNQLFGAPFSLVRDQQPAPGQQVPAGSSVALTVL